jgi:hypothetical protein
MLVYRFCASTRAEAEKSGKDRESNGTAMRQLISGIVSIKYFCVGVR